MTRRLAGLSANDIVDPETLADWALDAPQYICRLIIDGQDDELILEAGQPEGDTYAYVRIAGAEKNLVYKISGYDFEQIFQEGGKIFELPGILVDQEEVQRIAYATDAGNVAISRVAGAWALAEPQADAEVLQPKLDTIARTVLAWKAADYADTADGTGLDGDVATITISGGDQTHTIAVGSMNPSEKGYYARLDELDRVLVMSTRDEDQIFLEPSELFNKSLFDLSESAISTVELTQADEVITLTRGEGTWTATVAADTFETDPSITTDLVEVIALLQADKLQFEDANPGELVGSVTFTTDQDESFAFQVYGEQDGLNLVRLNSRDTGYWVKSENVNKIFPGLDALRIPEPVEEEAPSEE